MKQAARKFLEEDFLPHIEKRGAKDSKHEAGWSLSYHGSSHIGILVRYRKYDIYDSGHTLRAATKVLIQAGAHTVYPFTIARTRHSDDQ